MVKFVETDKLVGCESRIYGIARNYRGNLVCNTNKEPIIFYKGDHTQVQIGKPADYNSPNNTSIICKCNTHLPKNSMFAYYWNEPELAIIWYPKKLYITLANDLTRKVKNEDCHSFHSKVWKHSCSLHYYSVEIKSDVTNFAIMSNLSKINNYSSYKAERYGSYNEMIFSPKQIIKMISKYQHLYNGDIILTGTPKLVRPLIHINHKTKMHNWLDIYDKDCTLGMISTFK